jgi:hypothetical protein
MSDVALDRARNRRVAVLCREPARRRTASVLGHDALPEMLRQWIETGRLLDASGRASPYWIVPG